MASRREYEMLFQLNAQLGGSYNSTFKNAQGAIASMQQEISALNKSQSDITAYQKQQNAIEGSKKKLEVLQQQYDNIQKEMSETSSYSSTLENRLLSKQQQIDKTTASLSSQTDKLDRMGEALRSAGVDTSDLTSESARLGNQMDEIKDKQVEAAEQAQRYGDTATAAFGAVGSALTAAGITVGLKKIVEYYVEAIEESMIFESAMTGVAKTTDLTNRELATMGEEIKGMSTEIPIVTEELAGIGEVAGQLGIQKENLMDFTEVMAMLATATTMTAEEGATMLAQFANITQMDPKYYSNLASAVVDLGNNYATTEQKVIDMSQGIAASASLAGISESDMLGLSAAVTSLGIETQAGSTSMSKLIQELMLAVETGDGLKEFATIANMSADEFAVAWGDNAVTALQAFVLGLNDTERNGKSAASALTDLGITEVRMQRMILSLANSGDLLNNTLATSTSGWAKNSALVAEANLRYATTESRLTMMQNAYNNIKIAIGDDFNPELGILYQRLTNVLNNVEEFIQKNPALVKGFTAFIGVAAAATVAIAAYVAIAKIATVVTAALTAAIPGINVIMAVVGGVALLTGGIAALSEATKVETSEAMELTSVSRDQYYQLQDLNKEHQRTIEIYGESSYEAQNLQWQINNLNAEYENGRQTFEEYRSAHDELMSSYDEMTTSHTKSYEEIEKEERSAAALITKLEELTSTTDSAATNQQAILAIIEALNEQLPDLALNYDDLVGSSGDVIDYLYSVAEAEAAQKLLVEQWDEYINRVGQQDALKTAKETAEQNAKIAQEEYDIAYEALEKAKKLVGQNMGDSPSLLLKIFGKEEIADLENARNQLEFYNSALGDTTTSYEENADKILDLEDAFKLYQDTQEEIMDTGADMSNMLSGVTEEIILLSAAYEEAYASAINSVQGQYDLWDKAEEVVATSAGSINKALDSQSKYWHDYNSNLSNLSDRSKDIEGLAEMLTSFADGSADSVNAVAGMSGATDKELKNMVDKWQELQKEQKSVADNLAELETDFTNSMKEIQTSLESSIGEMNLSEEALESGKNTIQGFIDGAEELLPAVQAAYERIAQAGIDAIDDKLQIKSPSRVMMNRAEMTWLGYIKATEAMESDVKIAMAETANAGMDATATEATPDMVGGSGSPITLTVSPVYNLPPGGATGDIMEMFRNASEELRTMIIELLEDMGIDETRRAYA